MTTRPPPLLSPSDATEAMGWIHEQVARGLPLPLPEAELVLDALILSPQFEPRPGTEIETFFAGESLGTHPLRVSTLATALSRALGFAGHDLRQIAMAGLLHNVGMALVPRQLLDKPGLLQPAELEIIRQHPKTGARVLLQSDASLALAAIAAFEHHMSYDGNGGYPVRKRPRPTHRVSRIIQICDIYLAMRTERPNRPAWSQTQVQAHLSERAGIEVDPHITRTFLELFSGTR